MADKTVSYTDTANHWYWRAADPRDCQTGTVVTMPEDGKITQLELMVAGLNYNDPVYGYQDEPGRIRPTIWNRDTGNVICTGSYTTVPQAAGGSAGWVTFDLPDTVISSGTNLIVGFWRESYSTGYATQWPYATGDVVTSAQGQVTLAHNIWGSESGPLKFSVSETYYDRSINFKLHYVSGGRVKVWDGRSWVDRDVYVYDGSQWVKGTVDVYDGTNWNESGE